jgi:hypothetical protein
LDLADLRLVGEWTDGSGPADDWFYVFAGDDPSRLFEAPVYAGVDLVAALSRELGEALEVGLAHSTEWASRVIWPAELAGRPLFHESVEPRAAGWFSSILDRLAPRKGVRLADEVAAFLRELE